MKQPFLFDLILGADTKQFTMTFINFDEVDNGLRSMN